MASTMTSPGYFLLFLSCCMFSGRLGYGIGGPVFISSSIATASSIQPSFVTQTVYGFLDFTTTIGNTVMVFSPQSAAPDPEKDKTTEQAVNAVIDTQPVTSAATQPPPTIKPSKTQTKTENKPSEKTEKISTVGVVSAQSKAPAVILSKVEIVSDPSSKVNVVQSLPSVVNSHEDVQSKIEVVAVPASKVSSKSIVTKVEVISGTSKVEQPAVISSRVEVYEGPSSSLVTPHPDLSSDVDVQAAEEAIVVGNNIGEPEYDFLSRQPSEVVEETYKIINLKPSSKFHLKPRPSAEHKNKQSSTARSDPLHPTGLVTKLGGTIVKDGVTTVHETKVIGTYIAGKYAQVLQSTSHIQQQNSQKGKIKPSPTLRILKTAAPSLGKSNKHHLEPTPASSVVIQTAVAVETPKSSRKPSSKRFKNRVKEQESPEENEARDITTPSTPKRAGSKLRPTQASRSTPKQHTSQRPHKRNKKNGGKTARLATVSVHSDPPPTTTPASSGSRKFQPRKSSNSKQKTSTAAPEPNTGSSRRSYKARASQIHPSNADQSSGSTSLYKFKLNRAPGRWQYKTTAKPRVTIRKQSEDENNNVTTHSYSESDLSSHSKSDDVEGLVGSESITTAVDDEASTDNKVDGAFPLETLKVEISTPPDFKDTYYEIATIKSPYTFKIGTVKNTRYVTVTSTFQRTIESSSADNAIVPTHGEPLTENILATASHYEKDNNFLDSSVATLPPLYMASDMETPPLETMTETFSTTQTMLKTHILPAVRGGNITSSYTLVQTYLVTRFVTATKTLPPMDAYHFVPSKTLNEFNSYLDEAGSELNLELAFGDENDNESEGLPRRVFPADLDLANVGSNFDLSDVDKSNLSAHMHLRSKKAHPPTSPKPPVSDPLSIPGLTPEQIALLRLLNPAAAQGQVITTSKPVVKVETVYESHVLPLFNGHSTILTTISKALGTVTKTDYEFGTSTISPGIPSIPNLPIAPIGGLFQQPQQFAVTSSPVVQTTVVTETESKILKLTFGAKTLYTTILSTTVVPTVLTTYMTASVPVQPTAAFPGYFPAPYPPFQYLG
ncbi:hypothetical protein PPYR_06757 [Photinus pyralis]|uniref:DUF4758 domain-containing protein n=1 Tax=Photinus pyralis TaxID=7054 RepID=A0A5N4ANG9_PHOPY|nr:uncharacterized protein LOC116168678 isoform X1 [Photinus pyralis]KAB0798877.1 hypothetical protein PPYR_06757 [Photinus pyralis]